MGGDHAAESEARFDKKFDGAFVENGQYARMAAADRTDLGVRFRAEFRRAAAKELRGRFQLNVNFESDDWFECHEVFSSSFSRIFLSER